MVNRQTAVLSRAQARNLRKAAADIDIWRGGLERVFGRNEFNFYHPLYFLHYLDKASFLEFNPYIINGENYRCNPRLGSGDPKYEFKTNVGFATAVTSLTKDGKFLEKLKANINGITYYFATLNCPYGYSHSYFEKNRNHAGIDFPGWTTGVPHAPIISFIYGTVWGIKWEQSYGNILLIKDNNSDFLFLLAHLEKINVDTGATIRPEQIVALAGSTGVGGGGTPENVHLHLEVFNVRGKSKESVIDEESDKIWNNSFDRWNARKDPLNNMK